MSFVLLLAGAALVGCSAPAPEPLSLVAGTPAAGASIAVVAIAPCENAKRCTDTERGGAFARFDAKGLETAGLLFSSIAKGAHSGLTAELGALNNASLIQSGWVDAAESLVRADGFKVVAPPQSLYLSDELPLTNGVPQRRVDISSVPEIAGRAYVFVPVATHDVAAVGREAGADYVLAMDVLRHGVDRHFGGFGNPLTDPFAVGATRIYLIDTADGALLYNAYAEQVAVVSAEQAADKNVEREALLKATRDALAAAIDDNRNRLRDALNGAS